MVRAGINEWCSSAIALQSFDDIRKIVSFDDKDEFLYHLDAASVITSGFGAAYVTGTHQELLNQFAQIVCPIEEHGVRFA